MTVLLTSNIAAVEINPWLAAGIIIAFIAARAIAYIAEFLRFKSYKKRRAIAYELGAGEKLGINKRTFSVPCNVRAYDGHISVEWMYDRLSSKAKKLLDVCRSYIYDDNTDWDYSLDFNC